MLRDERGYDIRTVQALLGHQDLRTTMISRVGRRAEPGRCRAEAAPAKPRLTPESLRALDCEAPQSSAPASAPTERHERLCWQEDGGHLRQFIGAR